MRNKEIFESKTSSYTLLECDEGADYDVVTVGDSEENLVLNFEIGDSDIEIKVISPSDGKIIEEYQTAFKDADQFSDEIGTAVSMFESIKRVFKATESCGCRESEELKVGEDEDNVSADEIIVDSGENTQSDETDLAKASKLLEQLETACEELKKLASDDRSKALLEDISISIEMLGGY